MGEIYIKTCKRCGKAFKTDIRKGYVCIECKKANKRRLDKEYQKPQKSPSWERKRNVRTDIPLVNMVRLIEAYNQSHGTKYTYGKFVLALECEEIKLDTGERKKA